MNISARWLLKFLLAWITVGALCSAASPGASADESTRQAAGKRPKICLVLSGGGARGAAHVGVLKVLEEYRVPIDCIAGTSMGSLVGAAYATGMSVVGMQHIDASISTQLLFKETPPRQELSMRRKEDDKTLLVGPEFGLKGGSVSFGKGLVSGVQLETVLRQLSRLRGYHNFDELPIPFRAVATDLVTGKAVVFSEGEIANVMRASMSVPGAVAPAEFGGMILVDGMLTSNLPIEVARAMGADIIIAVNVGTPLLKREQLNDILGVTGQMLSILTEQNVRNSLALLKPTDILISPDLADHSTADFDNLPEIEPLGEAAARKMAARLSELSLPVADYAALRKHQQVSVMADTRPIDEIRFENLSRVNPDSAQGVMQTKVGEPVDQKTLDTDMRRLYGTGDFDHVSYRFLEETGKRVLAVDAVEKSWGPDYLRFGIGLSSDFSGDAYFNILSSYRKTWINRFGAEWRTDLQIGHASRLTSEFYQPLNPSASLFIAPYVNVERHSQTIFQGDDRIGRYDVSSKRVGLDVGSQFRQYGDLRIGAVYGKVKPKLDTGPPALAPQQNKVTQGAFTGRLILDQVDNPLLPRAGWQTSMNIFNSNRALGADEGYTKWDADGAIAYSLGNHSLNLALKAGGKIGSSPIPAYDQFQWGGFLQLSGYATGQLTGQEILFGRLMYYDRILHGALFEGAYWGVSLEAGKVGKPLVAGNNASWIKSGSIFIAADSPVGPAYLAYGRSADGHDSFYFYLGKPF